jgi:hypothetical protein
MMMGCLYTYTVCAWLLCLHSEPPLPPPPVTITDGNRFPASPCTRITFDRRISKCMSSKRVLVLNKHSTCPVPFDLCPATTISNKLYTRDTKGHFPHNESALVLPIVPDNREGRRSSSKSSAGNFACWRNTSNRLHTSITISLDRR